MTDKQIIIDGVDVSECKYWKGYCRIASLCDYPGHLCEVTPNCYYKQLKRKEQECEELRQYHNKCCEEFENEKQKLIDKYNQFSKDFFIGKYCKKEYCDLLKAKEQECEKLKKQIIDTNGLRVDASRAKQKAKRYLQKLEQIKEIAEKEVKHAPDGETFTRPEIKQVLQKISEVL